jgi:LytR cell envelope-related transcriptional attenuator
VRPVEHAYTTREPVNPWRTAAVVAAAVAAVELFILILVGVVFGAKLMTDKAETIVAQTQQTASEAPPPAAAEETPAKPKETAPVAELPRSRTSVIVLNGNGIPAAAAVGSQRVRKFDYIIAGTGNAPRTDFQRSVVMFRPGFEGEADRLAKDLKVKRVAPLDGLKKSDLQGAHIAFIVGG